MAAAGPHPLGRKPWDIPPLWFALAIALMVALHWVLPLAQPVAWPWRLVGAAPVLAGVGLAVWGERCFKRAGTAVRPFAPSTALVEDGPFRFTRNPMYLGLMLGLAGLWVLLGTLGPLLVPPLFFWLLQARFVVHEEAHMERHFSARYRDYRRRVRRWL